MPVEHLNVFGSVSWRVAVPVLAVIRLLLPRAFGIRPERPAAVLGVFLLAWVGPWPARSGGSPRTAVRPLGVGLLRHLRGRRGDSTGRVRRGRRRPRLPGQYRATPAGRR
ncbi:hypothetical protein [Streptomyces sp. NPDC058045]|uniref:hypothetical protein n=1 Tax=Streptomyces sp. NPDC058045 TaxID=3346311 RepID=UPI0036E0F2E4